MRRVVITGVGPLCAGGRGKEAFWRMLLEQRVPLRPIPPAYEEHYTYRTRYYVPAPQLDSREKSREEISKIALECARLALEDAELDSLAGAGVILGVGVGGLGASFSSHMAQASGQGRFNRLVVPLCMPNAPAAWIAMEYGADRDCHSINAACASGTVALGEAWRKIAAGELDRVLAGGVECLSDPNGTILRGFDSLQALTTAADGLPRPFSRNRSGFLFNQGAGCALILEEAELARNRGARVYAEMAGYSSLTAAGGIVKMPEDPARLLPLFRLAKGLEIGYFNAHGTGTEQNDRIEAELIRRLWGPTSAQPLVNSTKGLIGHSIGASGALEAAVTALSMREGVVHGNLTEDPVEDLNCPTEARELDMEYALSASYGFGGHNALLLLKRYRP